MPKLHEVLAVEGELKGANEKILIETAATFSKKAAHFSGSHKQYRPFNDAEAEAEGFEENHEMVTTVNAKLNHMWTHVSRYLDAKLQKERTNQEARANIEIDGKTIAEDVPATFLLGLESKIVQWRKVLDQVPTLAPGVSWRKDPDKGEHVYLAEHQETSFRTKKTVQHKILSEATDHHPAQIERWNEDTNVGKYITTRWCGMLSAAEKSELIEKLDKLSRAVKQARQRANSTEIVKSKIGMRIVDFLMT